MFLPDKDAANRFPTVNISDGGVISMRRMALEDEHLSDTCGNHTPLLFTERQEAEFSYRDPRIPAQRSSDRPREK